MGRRKSSSSSAGSGGGGKKPSATSSTNASGTTGGGGGGTLVEQLSMLRSFLGMENADGNVMVCGHLITESDLMDCHRKSGYNVQLAAERLMTGEYHQQIKQKKNNSVSSFKVKNRSTSSSSNNPSIKRKDPPMTAVKSKNVNTSHNTSSTCSSSAKAITPLATTTTTKNAVTTKNNNSRSNSNNASSTTAGSDDSSSSGSGGWLLCQRWLSDAVCTVRSGRIQYQEVLTIEHAYMSSNNNNNNSSKNAKTATESSSSSSSAAAVKDAPFVTSIRFRGTKHGVMGRLPDNIATLLSPLLRHDNAMLHMHAQALMEMTNLVTGSEIPISVSIYILKPVPFFQQFEAPPQDSMQSSSTKCSTGTQFWEMQKLWASSAAAAAASNNLQRGKRRRRMPLVQQAAFDLLQWAENGDVPDFVKDVAAAADPSCDDEKTNKAATTASCGFASGGVSPAAASTDTSNGDGDEPDEEDDEEEEEAGNLIELSEADFDNDDDATAKSATAAPPLPKDWGAGSDNAAALLPEAPDDPVGFKDGIRLCRPYQSQALYWMMQREKGVLMDCSSNSSANDTEPDSVMQEQMNLLSELVDTAASAKHRPSSLQPQQGRDVVCECGPVLLSARAQSQTKTLYGQAICPGVSHPLWSRRFLVKADAFVDASSLSLSISKNSNNIKSAAETMCFHVNEVLGVARHEPPEPPTPCRGYVNYRSRLTFCVVFSLFLLTHTPLCMF
jgi:hypothetical protein